MQYLMNDEDRFRGELMDGERILWNGKPEWTGYFSAEDVFLIPFSIVWGGFALFWESMVIKTGAPIVMAVFGIPFVLIGLYLMIGRFFYKKYKNGKTYYALTNKRALLVNEVGGRTVQSILLKELPGISKLYGQQGTGMGTIIFTNIPAGLPPAVMRAAASGMSSKGQIAGFISIKDVDSVYQMLMKAKEEQEK